MKILVLNYEFPPIGGGASPVSYDICKYYVKRGHKVVVVTMGYKGLKEHEMVEGIEIYRVKCLRSQVNVCHPWEQLSYLFGAYLFLKKHLKQNKYDINHTHFVIPTGVLAKWLKKKYHIPYIITAHGSDVIGHNKKRFGWLYTLLKKPWCSIVRNANAVIAPSKYLKELMETSEKHANYIVIPNGIDTSLFKPLEKQKYILVMGRLQETKAVDIVIQAMDKTDLEGWKLVIAGDGPQRERLEELTQSLNLADKVEFCGWIKGRSEKHLQLLGHASVFVSASRVENCPTSILEALSAGCKVIASDIDAHCQMVGENGQLFKKDDVSQLAELIQKTAIQEPKEIDLEKWKWEPIIDRYEESIIHFI